MRTLIVLGLAAGLSLSSGSPARTSTASTEPVRMLEAEGEAAKYWPRWRGPSGQGYVAGTNYTDTWSNTDGVKWRVAVPGLGHSSPIMWRHNLFITPATG